MLESLEKQDEYVAEVHVHLLPTSEARGQHYFIDLCPCNPIMEIEQDENENEVVFIYHNKVH